jgi:hypothetical protein
MDYLIVVVGLGLILAASATLMLAVPALAMAIAMRAMDPRFIAYEMTDGDRTIVFVEMLHVGTAAYYEAVRRTIAEEGARGATYLYERVGKGTPEEEARLRALLGYDIGMRAQRELLAFLARAGGLVVQPQDSFLGLTGRPDVRADLTVTEILDRLPPGIRPAPPAAVRNDGRIAGIRAWAERLGFLDDRNPVRRWLARQAVLAAIRLSIVQRHARKPEPRQDEKVMGSRDRHLADVVAATPGRIVITYGASHLRPFLALSPGLKVVRGRNLPLA